MASRCSECEQTYDLLEGRFPVHSFKGDACPMSDHAPTDWPVEGSQSTTTLGEILKAAFPQAGEPLFHAVAPLPPVVPSTTTTAETALVPPKRQVRSDKGKPRSKVKHIAAGGDVDHEWAVAEVEGDLGLPPEGLAHPPKRELRSDPAPKAKRSPRRSFHVVTGPVQSFSEEKAALAAVSAATAAWESVPEGNRPRLTTVIEGRVRPTKTTSVPASTTTKFVRERR